MSINAAATLNQIQNNTNQVNFQNGQSNLGTGQITQQGFMQLILAQLQYQDPTQPQDNSQMVQQQLQLQQANQMTDMVNATKFSEASTMIGKQVTMVDAPWDMTNNMAGQAKWDATNNAPATITGTITGVQFDAAQNKALIQINNGSYYDADAIQVLSNPTTSTTTGTSGTTSNGSSTSGS